MSKGLHTSSQQLLRGILADARMSGGLMQVEVATRFGKAQSFVSKVETGERQLNVFEFIDYCNALKLDPLNVLNRLIEHQPLQLPAARVKRR
ncbi:MAG: helix-turn-helix transcriptional regulator [Polaromonas sp.]|nr:helix-turn-helix transcriptional regulator [Polaromonas sp.]